MIPTIESLSHNARRSLAKGIFVGSITIIIYLLIVISTTPNLSPVNATFAALKTNSIIIIGLGIGIGAQIYISTYRKSLGCDISSSNGKKDIKRGRFYNLKKGNNILDSGGATTGGTTAALSSFFSFFSLGTIGVLWQLAFDIIDVTFNIWNHWINSIDRIFKNIIIS